MTTPIRTFRPGTPEIPCTSGMAVADMLSTLQEVVGERAYAQALASLPAEAREELAATTAVSWVRMTSLGAMLDGAAAAAGREPEAMVDETVRRSVERTFKTVWRMLLRMTSVDALIKRTPAIYARSRNVGELEASVLESGLAELVLRGWSDVSDRQLRVLKMSTSTILELTGRKAVSMTWERTVDGARAQLRWRE